LDHPTDLGVAYHFGLQPRQDVLYERDLLGKLGCQLSWLYFEVGEGEEEEHHEVVVIGLGGDLDLLADE
jgi:hypothetical protein